MLQNQQSVLSCPKHGVSLKVFRQPRNDGGADKTEAKAEEGVWVDDPRVALDLGVVPLIRPFQVHQLQPLTPKGTGSGSV